MADIDHKALIRQESRSPSEVGPGPRDILSGIVSDALSIARSTEAALSSERFRIGKYEFREPYYRQLLIWAKSLHIKPEALIQILEKKSFAVENGYIKFLWLNLNAVPLKAFDWVQDLPIEQLAIIFGNENNFNITFPLSKLRKLSIYSSNIKTLDLSSTPMLTELRYSSTTISHIDLSLTPKLELLSCTRNGIVEIELNNVPLLSHLKCNNNKITEINLNNLPRLEWLLCDGNFITKLNLLNNPLISYLSCKNNKIFTLDVRTNTNIKKLFCDSEVVFKNAGLGRSSIRDDFDVPF